MSSADSRVGSRSCQPSDRGLGPPRCFRSAARRMMRGCSLIRTSSRLPSSRTSTARAWLANLPARVLPSARTFTRADHERVRERPNAPTGAGSARPVDCAVVGPTSPLIPSSPTIGGGVASVLARHAHNYNRMFASTTIKRALPLLVIPLPRARGIW